MSVESYIKNLEKIFKNGNATEHTYRPAFKFFVESILENTLATNEPKRILCGAPDFILTCKDITVGYIEAKDIGKDLNDKEFKEQFERYKKALPTLVITNYIEFNFFKNGEIADSISIAKKVGDKIIPQKENFEKFISFFKNFFSQTEESITIASELARKMADKAKLLAEVLKNALKEQDTNTTLKEQYEAFKKILIHNIKEEEFSDIYAQSIAYGMFAGRLHDDSSQTFSRQEAAACIPKSNPFLRQLFGYIAGHDIDERIEWIVDDLAYLFLHVDMHEVLKNFGKKTQQEDPIIHFYETFLSEYDKKLRKTRGVWYTPKPVVNFIVNSIDEILQAKFDLKDGLADTAKIKKEDKEFHKVQILDPAAGTGAFLAEVAANIYNKNSNLKGAWSSYVDEHLTPRLYGFEILMASYAMAHLKMEMVLKDFGYKTTTKQERLRIYLTNSLEEAVEKQNLPFMKWFSDEANEANRVKNDMPVMVVLGNPPYSAVSQNNSDWIVNLIDCYKKEPSGEKLKERKHWLNDDYVKFIRFGQYFIEKNGEGILAYINNHSFLDNPTFRGMRYHLLQTFDEIYILNLHGNAKKQEKSPDESIDENVFDIQQGVSINIFIKTDKKLKNERAKVFYFDLFGKRENKYEFLAQNSFKSVEFNEIIPKEPNYFFVPFNGFGGDEYKKGFRIDELFRVNCTGIVTMGDDFIVAKDEKTIEERVKFFITEECDEKYLREKFSLGKNYPNWIISNKDGFKFDKKLITKILYRPFDNKYTYFSHKIIWRTRENVMQHFIDKENVGLVFRRQFPETQDLPIFISKFIIADGYIRSDNKGGESIAPLYTYDMNQKEPNLNSEIVKKFEKEVGLKFVEENGENKESFAPIDLLDYIYAVLHSPSYRQKYKEFLKVDFPRIPYINDKEKFFKLVKLGERLRKLHLLESDELNSLHVKFESEGSNAVDRHIYKDEKVYINGSQFFSNVPQTAWEFYIGGYQPAQKWLKERKEKILSYDDIEHYAKIINALYLTDKYMKEIDKTV